MAKDLTARMKKLGAAGAEKKPAFREAPRASDGARRTTIDLERADHKALKLLAVELDTTGAGVLRGMIRLASTDPDVTEKLRSKIADG